MFSSKTSESNPRRALWVAAVLLSIFAVAEVGLRLSAAVPSLGGIDAHTLFSEYPLEQHDGYFTLKKHYDGTLWHRPFRTNEHGFRGPSLPVAKEASNELRVLLMGTCITLGEQDETIDGYSIGAKLITERLQKAHPELNVRVINAAVPGSFELQYVPYFEEQLRRFDPDLIVLDNGSAQVVDPAAMLQEYRAREAGQTTAAVAGADGALAEKLYDLFSHSQVIRQFYGFRRNQEAVFRRHFYRREVPEIAELNQRGGKSLKAEDYIEEILDPSLEHYERSVARLYETLGAEAPVVAYTFPHAVPLVDLAELNASQWRDLGRAELLVGTPDDWDLADIWPVFLRSFRGVETANKQQATAKGVHYVDLMNTPGMRDPRLYDSVWFYTPWSSGSEAKAEVLSKFLLDTFEFSFDGERVQVRERGV